MTIAHEPDGPGPLRVVVVGPGAVGSFLGATLALAGHEVTLLGRRLGEADATDHVVLEDRDGSARHVPVRRATDPAEAGEPGLVILAVKAFDLAGALETAAQWPDAAVLTVQNGVGAEGMASSIRRAPVIAAALTTAVEPVAGGVRRLRTGGIGLAGVHAVETTSRRVAADDVATRLAASWNRAGLPARVYPDAEALKWSKLLANLVGNATSAILDMSPGAIYADRDGYAIERAQLQEAVAVMRARRYQPVDLPGASVSLLLRGLALPEVLGRPIVARAIARARGGKSPSLRLHVRVAHAGLPTEAPWLNGGVARSATVTAPAPVNARLAALVDEVAADPARAAHFARRPDRLAAELPLDGAPVATSPT
jgi:2-dehydropantoate 2-reductase